MPVAIAGMHRSGTSMITRLLNLCGLYLGDEKYLIPNAEDNPEGFWEHTKFQAINNEILALFNGAWDAPPQFEKNWEASPSLKNIYKGAEEVLQELSQPSLWGWKDPRNSLTLPFWKKQLPDLKIIICLRNPFDVYRSLERRGYASSIFSFNLWREYYQQIITSTTKEERIITHYDTFFYNPEAEVRRLTNFLKLEVSDEIIKTACQTISGNLRHNKSDIYSLYGTNADSQVIHLYREFCREAGPVHELYLSSAEAQFLQDTTVINHDSQNLDQGLQTASREILRLRTENVELEGKVTNLESKITELETEVARRKTDTTNFENMMNEVFTSRSWRFIQFLQKIRRFFIPLGSKQERILRKLYNSSGIKYIKSIASLLKKWKIKGFINQNESTADSNTISQKIYSDLIVTAKGKKKDEYVPITSEVFLSNKSLVKLIAFYLPQFHPIPENDKWWGKGFVEWTNVSKAVPQFVGHYQPHLPGELGFYDLRLPDIQKRQIELARKYGIHGFAFHYYWFNGKRLLEKPLDLFLESDEDFPFCICWANENWTRRWDGQENEVLISQNHSSESDLQFIQDVSPILKDKRYIRINGRPILIVYRANIIPDIKKTVQIWREYCINNGIGDLYLVAAQTFWFEDPRTVDFDAAVEFPPHNIHMTNIRNLVQICNPNYDGNVYAYNEIIEKKTSQPNTEYKVFKTIFPSWDNEARKPEKGNSFAFSTPARYKDWLLRTAKITLQDPDPEKRLIFINAWNEWGEGAHLEPDRKFGYGYLQATLDALKEIASKAARK